MKDAHLRASSIQVQGAKQNNLKKIDVDIPLYQFTVICGPSGSGKSSLAFETLFAEGQRQYTETLSNYVRQFIKESTKPNVEKIFNIPPPILLNQRNSIRSGRSTVGTHSEVLNHLRLIFSKVAKIQCPEHGVLLKKYSASEGAMEIQKKFKKGFLLFPIENIAKNQLSHIKKLLLQEGYTRIGLLENTKLKIDRLESVKKLSSSFYVLVDRLDFSDTKRVSDSLSLCYKGARKYNPHWSSGQALVYDLTGAFFYFSSKPICEICRYEFSLPMSPSLFSFNSILGACDECRGFGNILSIDENKVIPDSSLTLSQGAISIFSTPTTAFYRRKLYLFCKENSIDLHTPWSQLKKKDRLLLWNGSNDFLGVMGFFKNLETKRYKMHVRVFLSRHQSAKKCLACNGHRTRLELKSILFQDQGIHQWSNLNFFQLQKKLQSLKLSRSEKKLIQEPLKVLNRKVKLIVDIGLGYLQLNRMTKTLSGGELQRLNLAGQLSVGLSQVLYILDEPTIGLHPRDSDRLVNLLQELKNLGNTLLVIEHDPDVIQKAQYIIELGPGSGHKGGEVVYAGSSGKFFNYQESPTARLLMQPKKQLTSCATAIKDAHSFLEITGCFIHNLKSIDVKIPLHQMSVCSGVSGSGKTSLVVHTLYQVLKTKMESRLVKNNSFSHFKNIKGFESLKKVLLIDQSPAEKTKRSSVATYMKIYTPIREMMASTLLSQRKGFRSGFFSLNVEGGRCSECQGLGYQEIEMIFMDPVRLVCETCKGLKFQSDVLEVRFKDKNIHEILQMTIDQAMDFFMSYPNLFSTLLVLKKVGLEYLTLGQNLSTLSGGESQRLKLARELGQSFANNTFYILDEPSTGLHLREIDLLLKVLRELVQKGATVLLVEHNLQMMAHCDYIVDLGPEAGDKGGYVVAQDFLPLFLKKTKGETVKCLKTYLNQ